MSEFTILWDWLGFAVRWLHVITAMAWIGSSFYFIALDLGLNRKIKGPADGEEWQVHGGGFYHIQKYLIAPDNMPDHLTWFKWESYSTWLSGAALLVIIYWVGGEIYLIDPQKADLTLIQAVSISAVSLVIGWIIYDALCKSRLGEHPTLLMLLLFGVLIVMSWGYNTVFTGRAALLHLGAFTATIMTANVFFIIMPNQRIVVADLKAGRKPDAKYGKIAKLRSTHNNYLTLPVIFLMLSNHYPLAFATAYSWIIACLVFLMGVTIRHWFNTAHARKPTPDWTWIATASLFALIMWLSSEPAVLEKNTERDFSQNTLHIVTQERFAEVKDIVLRNCALCHADVPGYEGIAVTPKGVRLDTDHTIAMAAKDIYLQAGLSRAMPPPNVNSITEQERQILRDWYRSLN